MTEPGFREIQLSTKQLVFLSVATVVVAVVIFLLGVSVGRGVDANLQLAGGADTVPGDTTVSASPPVTDVGATDAGSAPVSTTPPPAADPVAAAADEPPSSSAPPVADPVVADPPPAPPPPDPDPVVAEPPAADPAPPAAGAWALQLGAFGARENADALVEKLRLRGYPVYLEQTDSTTVPFSVRVGPYPTRAQAEVASTRLSNEPEAFEAIIVR